MVSHCCPPRRIRAARLLFLSAVALLASVPLVFAQRAPVSDGRVAVAIVLPMQNTRTPQLLTDELANNARMGAAMAVDENAWAMADGDLELVLLPANAPTPAAAARAARRLIATQHVAAIVGGVGDGQAEALQRVAVEYGVLFFNIGDQSDALRSSSAEPWTFHVEASGSDYVAALLELVADEEAESVLLIFDDNEAGSTLAGQVHDTAGSVPRRIDVSSVAVPPDSWGFSDVISTIEFSAPDVVLVATGAERQDVLLAAIENSDFGGHTLTYPWPATQSRGYLATARESAPRIAATEPRLALWDASVGVEDGDSLSSRFAGRFATPLDPSGWAAYQAVAAFARAALAAGSSDAGDVADQLASKEFTLDVGKRTMACFDDRRQLVQPLLVVSLDTGVKWGRDVTSRIAVARVEHEVDPGGLAGELCGR